LLIQFALNFEYLYENDQIAMKAAANDKYTLFTPSAPYLPSKKYLQLQGIMQINNANIPNLLTPLMCLVDYKVY